MHNISDSSSLKANKNLIYAMIALWALGLVITGISPFDRLTWVLEVFPVLVTAPLLLWTHKSFPLPRYIYIWIFVHGVILMVGGHYTYAEVPAGYWVRDLLGLERNHYDRLGHLMQGFVPALVAREVLVRKVSIKAAGWLFFLTVTVCMAISVTYEFLEWWAALILDQGADAFLGTQGDPWDTQWDMFLATVGAILAQLIYWRKSAPNSKR